MQLLAKTVRQVLAGILSAGVLCLAAGSQQAPPPATAPPTTQTPPSPQAGANLFASSGCAQCHGPEGDGTSKAPSIHDVRKRKSDTEIYTQIKEGKGAMPPFGDALSEDEIRSIVAFLRADDGWKLMPSAAKASTPSS